MPITVHYIAKCGGCGRYPAPDSSPRATLEEVAVAALRRTSHDATAHAVSRGWSAYPVLCPDCAARAKEAIVTNKIAGLYLNLAKALNALEEAGEDLALSNLQDVQGETGGVRQDVETGRWGVVQA